MAANLLSPAGMLVGCAAAACAKAIKVAAACSSVAAGSVCVCSTGTSCTAVPAGACLRLFGVPRFGLVAAAAAVHCMPFHQSPAWFLFLLGGFMLSGLMRLNANRMGQRYPCRRNTGSLYAFFLHKPVTENKKIDGITKRISPSSCSCRARWRPETLPESPMTSSAWDLRHG